VVWVLKPVVGAGFDTSTALSGVWVETGRGRGFRHVDGGGGRDGDEWVVGVETGRGRGFRHVDGQRWR
jgi:hypothetical protein